MTSKIRYALVQKRVLVVKTAGVEVSEMPILLINKIISALRKPQEAPSKSQDSDDFLKSIAVL